MESCFILVSIHEDNPSFWFLGDSRSPKISLSFKKKGPVEIDFLSLTEVEQIILLNDWKDGKIVVNQDYQKMIDIWKNNNQKLFSSVKENIQQQKEVAKASVQQAVKPLSQKDMAKLKLQEEFEERQQKFYQRLHFLSKAGIHALRVEIGKENDIKLIRELLRIEQEKLKPRKQALEILVARQKELFQSAQFRSQQILGNTNVNSDEPEDDIPITVEANGETFEFSVVESDEENFRLSPEDLAKFAAGEPLIDSSHANN